MNVLVVYVTAFSDRNRLVVRVATPVHRAQHLTPEPDDVLTVGQVQRKGAGGRLRIEAEAG